VLRRIFGPRRDEVTGEWRRLHNEELNDLYSSTNIVRVITSGREQNEVRKCLLSFDAESFVFQVAIQKFKDQDI
jgi:hypothetical protein